MQIKVFRAYWGNYVADNLKLQDMRYSILKITKPILTILNADNGFAYIAGRVRKSGIAQPNLRVACFKQMDLSLLWEIKTDPDGFYKFKNISINTECVVTVFDPESGSWSKDQIVAK